MTRVDHLLALALLIAVFAPLQVVAVSCATGMPEFSTLSDADDSILVTDDPEVAKNMVYCHVACIDLIEFGGGAINMNNSMNSTVDLSMSNASNGTNGTEMFENTGTLVIGCGLRRYRDCRDGCIRALQGDDNCLVNCNGRCRDICGDNDCSLDTRFLCGINCNTEHCNEGCGMIVPPQNTFVSSGLDLERVDSVTYAVNEMSFPNELVLFMFTSVVFRIEDQSSPGNYIYQWILDIRVDGILVEYFLDLTAYACRTVSVSYAFVTAEDGLWEYSNPITIEVPGECVVIQLNSEQIDYNVAHDEREGFFAHIDVNVSWSKPASCIERVTGYTVELEPDGENCGNTLSETVDVNTTNVLLQSGSRIEAPCNYLLTVAVNPISPASTAGGMGISVTPEDIPQLSDIRCPITFDTSRNEYMIRLLWFMPFTPAQFSVIDRLLIRPVVLREEGGGVGVGSGPSSGGVPNINVFIRGNYSHNREFITYVSPAQRNDEYFRFTLLVEWNDGLSLQERFTSCDTENFSAPPPERIDTIQNVSVTVTNVAVSGVTFEFPQGQTLEVNLVVGFSWKEPTLVYTEGGINRYEAIVSLNPLPPNEAGSGVQSYDSDARSGIFTARFEDIDINTLNFSVYLQMRSNQFPALPSKWSEPMPISVVVLTPPEPVVIEDVVISGFQIGYIDGNANLLASSGDPNLLPSGLITWRPLSFEDFDGKVTIAGYTVRINDSPSTKVNDTQAKIFGAFPIVDRANDGTLTLTLSFQVIGQISYLGQSAVSPPVRNPHTRTFNSILAPRNVSTTIVDPRITTFVGFGGGELLLLYVEISASWLSGGKDITGYQVYFGYEELLPFNSPPDGRFFQYTRDALNREGLTEGTQITFEDEVTNMKNDIIYVQVRALSESSSDDTFLFPTWSEAVPNVLRVLPSPEISTVEFTRPPSLPETNSEETVDVTLTVNVEWVEPHGIGMEEPVTYELWVGVEFLDEYDQPEFEEDILKFEANTSSSGDQRLDFTIPREEVMDDIELYIQMRTVGSFGIPKWSLPMVRPIGAVPAPVIEGPLEVNNRTDFETALILVQITLQWSMYVTDSEDDGLGGGDQDPDTPILLPGPSPSPMTGGLRTERSAEAVGSMQQQQQQQQQRQRRQQDSIPGSGMGMGFGSGSGEAGFMSGSGSIPEDLIGLGDVTGVRCYVGQEILDLFDSPRSTQGHVFNFTANETSATIQANFTIEDLKGLQLDLFVQMQALSEFGVPQWSDPRNISIDIAVLPPGGVSSRSTDTTSIVSGVIAAIVCVLLVAIFLVAGFLIYKRRQFRIVSKKELLEPIDIYSQRPGIAAIYSGKGPILDEWEISPNDVIVEQLLGEGAFGEVYKGVIRGPLENPKVTAALRQAIGLPIAIKLLKTTSAGKEKSDFLAEIDMMKKIAEGGNPHIVNMVGCVTLSEPLCLITEFVPYGDLLSYLKYQRKKRSEMKRKVKLEKEAQNQDDKETPAPYLETNTEYSHLDPPAQDENTEDESNPYADLGDLEANDLIKFAYQIAIGMEYLASLNIVHRDLACRNVLIAKDKLLKITDFGLSREVQEVYVKKTRGRLPLKWMAIESITAREFTTASDVWSFGITLYEIGTIGGFPYPAINNEDLLTMLKQGHRLEKPENCSPEVYDLMLKCWEEDALDRPSFSILRSKFSSMLQAGSVDEYIDLQVNEEAPYYKVKEDFGEQRYSSSSASSDDSESSIMKEKRKPKEKLKRKITNPYVVAPSGAQENRGDAYFDLLGAEQQQPLGIPISQLMQSSTQPVSESVTATTFMPESTDGSGNNAHPLLEPRTTNPYVEDPSQQQPSAPPAAQPLQLSLTRIDEIPTTAAEVVFTPEEQLTAL